MSCFWCGERRRGDGAVIDDPVSVVVLAAYASLALELSVFAVPSEASTRQLVASSPSDEPDGDLDAARGRSKIEKLLRFGLPTVLGVALFLVPIVLVFLPERIEYVWPISALQTTWLPWLGVGLIVAGRGLTLRAAMRLRRRSAQQVTRQLEFDGVFRFTRNPILVGMYLFYLGNCCVFPCVVLVAGLAPYVLYMHARVRMEEGYLARELGEPYEAYLRRVPRYLLF
jgi:protein-S-isoprenylcysteine O-methyltransferase Ste14